MVFLSDSPLRHEQMVSEETHHVAGLAAGESALPVTVGGLADAARKVDVVTGAEASGRSAAPSAGGTFTTGAPVAVDGGNAGAVVGSRLAGEGMAKGFAGGEPGAAPSPLPLALADGRAVSSGGDARLTNTGTDGGNGANGIGLNGHDGRDGKDGHTPAPPEPPVPPLAGDISVKLGGDGGLIHAIGDTVGIPLTSVSTLGPVKAILDKTGLGTIGNILDVEAPGTLLTNPVHTVLGSSKPLLDLGIGGTVPSGGVINAGVLNTPLLNQVADVQALNLHPANGAPLIEIGLGGAAHDGTDGSLLDIGLLGDGGSGLLPHLASLVNIDVGGNGATNGTAGLLDVQLLDQHAPAGSPLVSLDALGLVDTGGTGSLLDLSIPSGAGEALAQTLSQVEPALENAVAEAQQLVGGVVDGLPALLGGGIDIGGAAEQLVSGLTGGAALPGLDGLPLAGAAHDAVGQLADGVGSVAGGTASLPDVAGGIVSDAVDAVHDAAAALGGTAQGLADALGGASPLDLGAGAEADGGSIGSLLAELTGGAHPGADDALASHDVVGSVADTVAAATAGATQGLAPPVEDVAHAAAQAVASTVQDTADVAATTITNVANVSAVNSLLHAVTTPVIHHGLFG